MCFVGLFVSPQRDNFQVSKTKTLIQVLIFVCLFISLFSSGNFVIDGIDGTLK